MPHGWGANLLMYNTQEVTPGTDLVERRSSTEAAEQDGKVTAYDSPIYIADAALYLMTTQPDLGIENPYALDEDQLAAAVDLLEKQSQSVGEYWADYTKEITRVQDRLVDHRHDLADHRQPGPGRRRPGRGGAAGGGRHRLVRHLDGRNGVRAQELRVPVAGLDRLSPR